MSACTVFLLIISFYAGVSFGSIYTNIVKSPGDELSSIYYLPSLPFGYSDLEPYIDQQTVRVHYLGHHKSYTDKMNTALVEWKRNVRC